MPKLRLWHKIVLITAVAALVSALPSFASEIDEQRQRLDSMRTQIERNREKINEANQKQAELILELKTFDDRIAAIDVEISRLGTELAKTVTDRTITEARLSALQARLIETERQLEETQARLAQQNEVLNRRVKNIYKDGKTFYVQVILNATSFSNFLTRVSFLELLLAQDGRLLRQIEETKAAIEVEKAVVEREKQAVAEERLTLLAQEQRITALTDEQKRQKQAAEAERANKQALVDQIQQDKIAYQKAVEEELEASEDITARIRALEEEARRASSSGTTIGPGGFLWPTSGSVTSPFGMRWHPILGGYRMHTGVDIGAPYGQDIKASRAGAVITAGWVRGYGLTVILSHGDGYSTLYAHASELLVSEGQEVAQGAVIAKVGSSGYSTGPHLHFEIRVSGEPRDPMQWF